MFVVNGKEFTYDIFDTNHAKRFEDAMNYVKNEMSKLNENHKNLTFSHSIETQCKLIMNCFDMIFGEGTSVELFEDSLNLKTAMTAFMQLMNGINEQKDEMNAFIQSVTSNSITV